MNKVYLILILLFLNQCSTSSPQVKSCKVKKNLSVEKTDPKWFVEKENEEFYYIVKNKEYSGDSNCSDQNSSIKYIRNSKNSNDVQMFKNGQLVKNLNGQFKIEESVIIEGNNKFISYLKFKKLKK